MAIDDLTIQYRGPLESCNYACGYCPFARQVDPAETLEEDRLAIERLTDWVAHYPGRISIFFAPRGEALIRPWYRHAIQTLSHLPNTRRIVVQTNLSCPLEWLRQCDRNTVALWCTYHPTQVHLDRFLRQCSTLDDMRIRYSVGSVGMLEELPLIEELRSSLSPFVYLWVNAFKHEPEYYSPDDIDRIEKIDPLFRINTIRYASFDRPCRTGKSVIAMAGDGTIQRCLFDHTPVGNLYESDLKSILENSPCAIETCCCHIGYIHLAELGLQQMFRDGLLERIPAEPIWRDRMARAKARLFVESLMLRESGVPLPPVLSRV